MKVEWGCNPVCWWLSLYFCFVCSSDEGSCTGCYWWLGDAESCIQEVYFVWVFTIWYSLESVLWYSRVLESVLPLQRLWAWSHKGCFLILATWLSESAVALLCIIFILWSRWMKKHPWGPGEVAGALPELDMEAWALVLQGRGHEGKEAGSLPSMELALGSVATAGMLSAPGANGAAENTT